jgi:iron complex outermembrane receptor protein
MMNAPARFFVKSIAIGFTVLLVVAAPLVLSSQDQSNQASQEEKEKQQPKITEEILVVGKAPKDVALATVTEIGKTTIEALKPRDLAEALKFATGVAVTVGNKDEYTLKIRGIDSKRIALLVDGVPVVEPYYGSFDLKTVSAGQIESLQVTKGPSSVLYGPNTMGGIVNVITRRPSQEPFLSLSTSLGDRTTRSLGLDSSAQWKNLGFVGTALYQGSDGFVYDAPKLGRTNRSNSDYERLNLNAKLYYIPSSRTEFMVNAGYYTSAYGMPPDLISKPRYWRFKNWDRASLNAGGYTALGDKSTFRFRAFYVNYQNSLDWYNDAQFQIRQSESAFDNSVYGLFGLGDLYLNDWNSLKVSLYYQKDKARTQDDLGSPWTEFDQGTFSLAAEDHVTLLEDWKLIAGASWDRLSKFEGSASAKLNPLIGVKYAPGDDFEAHLSFSGKSKFPNMRALYSPSSGNPALLSERAQSWELGATYNKAFYLSGAVFVNTLRDMIDTVLLPDGTRQYRNIGKAHVNGAEIQVQKAWPAVQLSLNYTYLDHKNESDDRPLDVLSDHNLNFEVRIKPLKTLNFSVFGLYASKSYWYDTGTRTLLDIPSYWTLDAVASYGFSIAEIFVKIANLMDEYYYTEPGFPWRGRTFEAGCSIRVF